MVLEIINNFLFKQELFVIDLIFVGLIITVGGALILFLLGKLSPAILRAIKKAFKPVKPFYEYIARLNRFRKRKITPRDYKNILTRLEHGVRLKWYEKEAFYEAKKQMEGKKQLEDKLMEAAKSMSLGIAGSLDFKAPQINIPDRKDT